MLSTAVDNQYCNQPTSPCRLGTEGWLCFLSYSQQTHTPPHFHNEMGSNKREGAKLHSPTESREIIMNYSVKIAIQIIQPTNPQRFSLIHTQVYTCSEQQTHTCTSSQTLRLLSPSAMSPCHSQAVSSCPREDVTACSVRSSSDSLQSC